MRNRITQRDYSSTRGHDVKAGKKPSKHAMQKQSVCSSPLQSRLKKAHSRALHFCSACKWVRSYNENLITASDWIFMLI